MAEMILIPKNTQGRTIMAYAANSFFHKNRLIDPQDLAIAILMVTIIIWILETP